MPTPRHARPKTVLALLAPLLAAAILPPAACERKSEPGTLETELERRRGSLMDEMDKIAAEHEEEPAPDAAQDAAPEIGPDPDPESAPDAPEAAPESPVSPP